MPSFRFFLLLPLTLILPFHLSDVNAENGPSKKPDYVLEMDKKINEEILQAAFRKKQEEKIGIVMHAENATSKPDSDSARAGLDPATVIGGAVAIINAVPALASSAVNLVNGAVNMGEFGLEVAKRIDEMIKRKEEREGFMRGLLYEVVGKLDNKCNVLVFNLNWNHESKLSAPLYYKSFEFLDAWFGLFIFEHGSFINKALLGKKDRWGLAGDFDVKGLSQNVATWKHKPCLKFKKCKKGKKCQNKPPKNRSAKALDAADSVESEPLKPEDWDKIYSEAQKELNRSWTEDPGVLSESEKAYFNLPISEKLKSPEADKVATREGVEDAIELIGAVSSGFNSASSVANGLVSVGNLALKVQKAVDAFVQREQSRAGFLRALLHEMVFLTGGMCNVMVYNLNKGHEFKFKTWIYFQSYKYKKTTYGVWLLDEGWFQNKALVKDNKWAYAGKFRVKGLAKGRVEFDNVPCHADKSEPDGGGNAVPCRFMCDESSEEDD